MRHLAITLVGVLLIAFFCLPCRAAAPADAQVVVTLGERVNQTCPSEGTRWPGHCSVFQVGPAA